MALPLPLALMLVLPATALLVGPPPAAEVPVLADALTLLNPPADARQARGVIHEVLLRGCQDLSYLNQKLAACYQAQEPDLALAKAEPEQFRQPLPPADEARCARVVAAVRDPAMGQREQVYRQATQALSDRFATAMAGHGLRPENADGNQSVFAQGVTFGPSLDRLQQVLTRIDELAGAARPEASAEAIQTLTGSALEVELKILNKNEVWLAAGLDPQLSTLKTSWAPYQECLARLAEEAAQMKGEENLGPAPLRRRIMGRALMIQVGERYRTALSMNLRLWLLAAAARPNQLADTLFIAPSMDTLFDDRNRNIFNKRARNPDLMDSKK
jgi:hypothetical protein